MSVNIRIKLLDGRELDYTSPESLNIKMNRIADDLNNPDNRFSEYSYTFSLPKTKNNVEIFEYAGVNAIKNSFKTNPIECRLYNDEKLILDGQIELRSVDDSYNCVFYSKFVQLVDSIKGKNLRDIQSLPHISGFTYEDYIRDHINADYSNCDETPFQFPFVFYNTIYTPTGVYSGVTDQNGDQFRKDTNRQNYYNLLNRTSNSMPNEFYFHQFPLSWYLKPVLEAMLKDAGWTLGGSFFENDNIKKIIMPYVGDSDVYDLATYCSKEPQVTYEIIYNWVQEVPNMSLKSAAITNVNRISPTIYFDDIVGTDIILDSLTGSISGSTTFIGQQYIGDYSSGDFNIDTRKYQIVATQTFTRKDYIVYQNGNFVSSGSTTFDQQVIVYPGISKFLDPIVANMLIADGDVIRIEVTEYFTELDCTIDGTVDYGTSIPSPTPTMTPNFTPSPTRTPSVTPSITPSISVSPSLTPSITPTPSETPSVTPSMIPSVTPSMTPSETPSMSITPTPSVTPSTTPSETPSVTPSTTPSETPSVTPSTTPSMSITPTPSVTPSMTPTPSTTPVYTVQTLVVGGGGGGGSIIAGGGGGGGYVYNSSFPVSITGYSITIGQGGAGGTGGDNAPSTQGSDGTSSVFSTITAAGGGGGGSYNGSGSSNGRNGGCGGGGGSADSATKTGGTGSQGGNGGNGKNGSTNWAAGGGGGAGGNGSAPSVNNGGNGGSGIYTPYFGEIITYAGGGGGGSHPTAAAGTGGSGGGGNGSTGSANPTNGADGYGGGGGGASYNRTTTARGGSGIVIIMYPTSQFGNCTGGTKSTYGSNTIHKFTTNGTMTFVAP